MSETPVHTFKNLDLSTAIELPEAIGATMALPRIDKFDVVMPFDGVWNPAAPLEEAVATRLGCDEEMEGVHYKTFRPDSVLNSLMKAYRISNAPALVIARVNLGEELPKVEYLMPHNADGSRSKSVSMTTTYVAKNKKIGRGEERLSLAIERKTTPKTVDLSAEPYCFYIKPRPNTDGPFVNQDSIFGNARSQGRAGGTSH